MSLAGLRASDPVLAAAAERAGTVMGDTLEIPLKDWLELRHASPRIRGLGDVAAIVAEPIAKAFAAATGRTYVPCDGCWRRRERLNQLLPLR